jgi:hypothetical protein
METRVSISRSHLTCGKSLATINTFTSTLPSPPSAPHFAVKSSGRNQVEQESLVQTQYRSIHVSCLNSS